MLWFGTERQGKAQARPITTKFPHPPSLAGWIACCWLAAAHPGNTVGLFVAWPLPTACVVTCVLLLALMLPLCYCWAVVLVLACSHTALALYEATYSCCRPSSSCTGPFSCQAVCVATAQYPREHACRAGGGQATTEGAFCKWGVPYPAIMQVAGCVADDLGGVTASRQSSHEGPGMDRSKYTA